MVRLPCPTKTSSSTRPAIVAGPSTDTTGPLTTSPVATTSAPERLIRRLWLPPPPPPFAAAGPAATTTARSVSAPRNTNRRRMRPLQPVGGSKRRRCQGVAQRQRARRARLLGSLSAGQPDRDRVGGHGCSPTAWLCGDAR